MLLKRLNYIQLINVYPQISTCTVCPVHMILIPVVYSVGHISVLGTFKCVIEMLPNGKIIISGVLTYNKVKFLGCCGEIFQSLYCREHDEMVLKITLKKLLTE